MKRLLSVIVVLFAVQNGYARSWADIIAQVRTNLKDTGPADSYRYSDVEILRAVNFIHNEICREALLPETSYSTTTTAGVSEYSLPTDITGVPTRVAYYNSSSTDTFRRLEYKEIGALDTDDELWENLTNGRPEEYYLRANKIGLSPAPSVSYSTTSWVCLKVYYVKIPSDVTTSTSTAEPFGGYPQYQTYSNMIVAGTQSILTGMGYELYYTMLSNISIKVKENYDAFISRTPNRREY